MNCVKSYWKFSSIRFLRQCRILSICSWFRFCCCFLLLFFLYVSFVRLLVVSSFAHSPAAAGQCWNCIILQQINKNTNYRGLSTFRLHLCQPNLHSSSLLIFAPLISIINERPMPTIWMTIWMKGCECVRLSLGLVDRLLCEWLVGRYKCVGSTIAANCRANKKVAKMLI